MLVGTEAIAIGVNMILVVLTAVRYVSQVVALLFFPTKTSRHLIDYGTTFHAIGDRS